MAALEDKKADGGSVQKLIGTLMVVLARCLLITPTLIIPAAYSGTLLTGDDLLVQHIADNNTLASWNVVVPEIDLGAANSFPDPAYYFYMNNSGILLYGACCAFHNGNVFEGLVFEGFDPSLIITGFTLRGSWTDLTPDRVSFTDASITFDFTNLRIDNTDALEVQFLTAPASPTIPLPPTVALFSIGLAGLGWSRRRKA